MLAVNVTEELSPTNRWIGGDQLNESAGITNESF